MRLDASLFAVLRIVAMMIAQDGKIAPQELNWFKWLLKRYDVTAEMHDRLLDNLKADSTLDDYFYRINNQGDRDRLNSWLRIAMDIDGHRHKSETELYKRVMALNQTPIPTGDPSARLARLIVEHEDRLKFWEDLASFGKALNQSVRGWRRF